MTSNILEVAGFEIEEALLLFEHASTSLLNSPLLCFVSACSLRTPQGQACEPLCKIKLNFDGSLSDDDCVTSLFL